MSDSPATPAPVPASLPVETIPPPSLRARFLARVKVRLRHPWRLLAIVVLLCMIGVALAALGLQARAYYHFRAGCGDLERHHNAEALAHFQVCMATWSNDSTTLLL